MFFLATAFAALSLSSCSSDDDFLTSNEVPEAVQNTFEELYKTRSVTWEMDEGMMKAEFRNNGKETEAWFTHNGTWVKTETDCTHDLPEYVKNYIATNYPDYTIDDADYVETPTETYYDIELEHPTKQDVHLKIKTDGTVTGGQEPTNQQGGTTEQPTGNSMTAAQTTFTKMYPGVQAEWEMDKGMVKAEFYYNGEEAEAWFKQDGTWVKTEFDYHSTLPTAVQNYIATNYAEYTVDDVEWIETPAGNYFEIELDHRTKTDIKIRIKTDGTLVSNQ